MNETLSFFDYINKSYKIEPNKTCNNFFNKTCVYNINDSINHSEKQTSQNKLIYKSYNSSKFKFPDINIFENKTITEVQCGKNVAVQHQVIKSRENPNAVKTVPKRFRSSFVIQKKLTYLQKLNLLDLPKTTDLELKQELDSKNTLFYNRALVLKLNTLLSKSKSLGKNYHLLKGKLIENFFDKNAENNFNFENKISKDNVKSKDPFERFSINTNDFKGLDKNIFINYELESLINNHLNLSKKSQDKIDAVKKLKNQKLKSDNYSTDNNISFQSYSSSDFLTLTPKKIKKFIISKFKENKLDTKIITDKKYLFEPNKNKLTVHKYNLRSSKYEK